MEARAGARRLGPARLRGELRARGIDAALAEAAISERFGPGAEEALALAAARQRLPALERRDPRRAAARLRDHLLRLGHPAGVVARVVRTLCKPDSSEPE